MRIKSRTTKSLLALWMVSTALMASVDQAGAAVSGAYLGFGFGGSTEGMGQILTMEPQTFPSGTDSIAPTGAYWPNNTEAKHGTMAFNNEHVLNLDGNRVNGGVFQFTADLRAGYVFAFGSQKQAILGLEVGVSYFSGTIASSTSVPWDVSSTMSNIPLVFGDDIPLSTQAGTFRNNTTVDTGTPSEKPTSLTLGTAADLTMDLKNSCTVTLMVKPGFAINKDCIASCKLGVALGQYTYSAYLDTGIGSQLFFVNQFPMSTRNVTPSNVNIISDYNDDGGMVSESLSFSGTQSKYLAGLAIAPMVEFQVAQNLWVFVEAKGLFFFNTTFTPTMTNTADATDTFELTSKIDGINNISGLVGIHYTFGGTR